jgi:hypothetical protein
VGEGIVVAAGDASLEGMVKRSVNIFTGNGDVSGSIGRDLTMAGGSLTLTNTARVGGNLGARVHHLLEAILPKPVRPSTYPFEIRQVPGFH